MIKEGVKLVIQYILKDGTLAYDRRQVNLWEVPPDIEELLHLSPTGHRVHLIFHEDIGYDPEIEPPILRVVE